MGTRPATRERAAHAGRTPRRAALLPCLVAALACACGASTPAADDAPDDASDATPAGAHADAHAAAPTGAGAGASTGDASPGALRAGDLLVLDMDAGEPTASGERTGVLFRVRPGVDGGGTPELWATDPRWLEPVDLLVQPDGSVLVLDQAWTDGSGPARGAIFRVPGHGAAAELWWTDARTRQPVAMARRADGTLLVSDRAADPDELGAPTGCVFALALGEDGAPHATVVASGPELVTPGALLCTSDGRTLLMDADANPRNLHLPDGRAATPGVLYELTSAGLVTLLQPERTVSPIALLERSPGEIYLVDANAGTGPRTLGDGALFRVGRDALALVLDTASLERPRALVDPVGGDVLADGRLALADANVDPLGLGDDGTGKGVYGTGHGAVLAVDPDRATVSVLIADPAFVSPVAVRRVR